MTKQKPFAFVLMPFGDEFKDIYDLGIKAAADEKGIRAERVDEQFYTDGMLARIHQQIEVADFIIADTTGKNPNVFYEVGYAHAKEKLCTLITKKADDIPFDLKHHRHLVYDGSISKLKKMLGDDIDWIKSELERRNTVAFEVVAKPYYPMLLRSEYSRTGTFELIIDIHNRTKKRSPEIDSVYLYTSEKWTIKQDGKQCGHTKSEDVDVSRRHLLSSSTRGLAPGAWTQIRCELEATFWLSWFGETAEAKDSYKAQGFIIIEISTGEGNFKTRVELNIDFEELPF